MEKQQRKEWKINRKKTESPSPKFTACDLIWEKKTKQTRTKTRVKQYKNPPISLFSKSKHMPRHPHGSSSSFTSLTPSYCFCFCCTKTKNPKPKKKQNQSDGLLRVLVSIRDSPRKRTEPPNQSAQYPDSTTFYYIYWLCTNRRSSFFLWVLFLWPQSCHQQLQLRLHSLWEWWESSQFGLQRSPPQ